jgi:protein O-GlcNAc transferase
MTPLGDKQVEQDQVSIEAPVRAAFERLAQGDAAATLAALAPLVSGPEPSVSARFLLGMTAWRMGRFDWAIQLLSQCHDSAPMEGTIVEALASLYAQIGNIGESLFMGKLGTALGGPGSLTELVPQGFPSFDWAFVNMADRPLLARAKQNLARGKLGDAVTQAAEHVTLDPADAEGRIFFAETLLRAGAASETVEVLRPDPNEAVPAAAQASLYARALAAVGDYAEAHHWHAQAADAAPQDAALAAARVADGLWLDDEPAQRAAAGEEWARRFAPPAKPQSWRPVEDRLVIGYVVAGFVDPRDAAAVAAVARAHDRGRVQVMGYGRGAQSWQENTVLSGAFDTWQDIGSLDAATIARFFARDGNQLIIDAAGFAAPNAMLALARLPSAVRISWLGNPAGLGAPIYDWRIAAGAGSGDTAWRIAGGYPVLHRLRAKAAPSDRPLQFGADVGMVQLDAGTVALWSAILAAMPEAKLVLRANDATPGNVDRLIGRFGRDLAARIDILPADRAEDFYDHVDVALTPRRGASPRMAAEAVGCGVPPVALAEPYASFLADLGLGTALVAKDDKAYVRMALKLARSASMRERVTKTLLASAPAGPDSAQLFARALEAHAAAALTLRAAS